MAKVMRKPYLSGCRGDACVSPDTSCVLDASRKKHTQRHTISCQTGKVCSTLDFDKMCVCARVCASSALPNVIATGGPLPVISDFLSGEERGNNSIREEQPGEFVYFYWM